MNALWILLFLLGFLFLVKAIYVVTLVIALPRTGGALFCVTHPGKISAVLKALPLGSGDQVLDLGCGDGRFLAAAAQCGVRGAGYELNWLAWFLGRLRQSRSRGLFRIERRDFWNISLAEADLVFCYLFPDLMPRLAEKARKEMKAGAVLVSCNFPLPGWEAERVLIAAPPTPEDPIYLYRQGFSDSRKDNEDSQ